MTDFDTAMVLAAGLGTRIRSKFPDVPKPLVPVLGKPLIDYTLDLLQDGGVKRAVVNVHHLADQIEHHLVDRTQPNIVISDEREELLETGGGILKALGELGNKPFFSVNTDAIIMGRKENPARQLANAWGDAADALLLLVPLSAASGYIGEGDFALSASGDILPKDQGQAYIFTGLQLLRPSLFEGHRVAKVSTRMFWDIAQERGRFKGVVLDGAWMHVGDPDGHAAAEERLTTRNGL
ncbi:MAG: nucleotidyltransferase family protein [Parvularcula sp.]|jgi:MurNAc alpha-1-phosphate uridylyltransferase|nr:nucleotidyltransferase family protein [Parvularcula sp.]